MKVSNPIYSPSQPSKTGRRKRYEFLSKERKRKLWPIVEKFYEREMKPVLDYISEEKPDSIKISLRKYLIISCVSLIEDILSHLILRVIDDNNMPIASLVGAPNESEAIKRIMKFSKKNKIGTTLTKGEYVALTSGFTNPITINTLFTGLLNLDSNFSTLNMDFFDAIRKVDWYNPYRDVKGRRPMRVNWKRFMEMFELRTKIIHEMGDVELSYLILSSNCDNTINFLDAAVFVVDPKYRGDVINQLQSKKPMR